MDDSEAFTQVPVRSMEASVERVTSESFNIEAPAKEIGSTRPEDKMITCLCIHANRSHPLALHSPLEVASLSQWAFKPH